MITVGVFVQAMDEQGRSVGLTAIVGGLEGNMSAVLLTDRGTVAVWGDVLEVADTPEGEAVVEVPVETLLEAARAVL